jgi:ribosomal protein S18 acetylase RimI-like enzyme
MRPRERKRDAILGHVASWGDRRTPINCITAKPARAVNALAGLAALMTVVAIAGFAIQQGQKRAHKREIWGMYVRPDARRTGIGRRLIEAIVELARHRVELIQLTVVRDNEQARRLYASLGFLEYGIERNALKQDGRYYDEVLMAKDLLQETRR